MPVVLSVIRYFVLGVVVLAALAALASWIVRGRRVSPFSALGRGLRSFSDPILRPVEKRLVRMGGSPSHAGGWLIVITAVVGIVFLSLAGWLITTFQTAQHAASTGPRATFRLLIEIVYRVVVYALVIRIVASWFGAFRYSRWVRPAYVLTDWVVEPVRRVVPPLGAIDISPLVAWLVLLLLRQILLSMLTL